MNPQDHATRRLVPVATALELLGDIGRTKLYDLIGAGELSPVKLGRRTMFVEAEIVAYADGLPRGLKPKTSKALRELPRLLHAHTPEVVPTTSTGSRRGPR